VIWITTFQLFINVLGNMRQCTPIVMLHCDNKNQMEVLETRMELVILSTLATIAILVAELSDLALRDRIGRPVAQSGAPRLASLADLSRGSRVANEEGAASHPELDRAA
jgi:hypothetical protein